MSNTYIYNWDILSEILPSYRTIGQNENLILYMLSNKFVVNHVNNEIHSVELEKEFFVIQEVNKFKIGKVKWKKIVFFLKTSSTL